jgi:hypothetical protein
MILMAALACSQPSSPPAVPAGWTLDAVEGRGLSGLSMRPDGTLWAVSERSGSMRRVGGDGQLALVGVPAGLEPEALAWIDEDRFVLGTESDDAGRSVDVVLFGRVEGGQAVVVDQWSLELAKLGVAPVGNKGLEAACVSDGTLVVVTELVDERAGRWAPYASRALEGGAWTTGRLKLSTSTGKVAGLACTADRAWAIERHYGVAHVLDWALPATGDVIGRVVLDIDAAVTGDLPNLEGIVRRRDGGLWLISDNDHGGVTGPSLRFGVPSGGML